MGRVYSPREKDDSNNWQTPHAIIECLHEMWPKGIDFDPCSSDAAARRLKTRQHFTAAQDGLKSPWPYVQTVYCNPPGGKLGAGSRALYWWAEFCRSHYDERRFTSGVFCAFNLEILRTSQGTPWPATRFPFCLPRARLRFLRPDGTVGASPSHANALICVGDATRFSVFSRLGEISWPAIRI